MNILFRADASQVLGAGHIMRCLTLAEHLKNRGGECSFLCRAESGNMLDFIISKGFPAFPLKAVDPFSSETDAEQTLEFLLREKVFPEWLIVDHYLLDAPWELFLRPWVKKVMVRDDLANRSHDCEILLDQNFIEAYETRYKSLVSSKCQQFLGPRFALLRPEFFSLASQASIRHGPIRRIFIFFGGSDETGETLKLIQALSLMNLDNLEIQVVIGKINARRQEIESLIASQEKMQLHCQIENMAELMLNADLAFGACGTTSWERCCLGLPAIVTVLAENQRPIATALNTYGAVWNLGDAVNVQAQDYSEKLQELFDDPFKLSKASEKALSLTPHGSHPGFLPLLEALIP